MRMTLALLVGGLSGAWASAQIPAGGQFRVNTYTTNEQYESAVAGDGAGHFVVAWQSAGQDGHGWGVFAQRYDAAGRTRGAEFRVNTHTADGQYAPAVASDAAGNFVVAWASAGQDGSGEGVFAQRYDVAGAPRGGEFQVSTHTVNHQYSSAVASGEAGDFVVVWMSYAQDGDHPGIFGQRYDAAGQERGSEFRVNTYTPGFQGWPAVASDAAGNFVVVWTSDDQDGDQFGVFGQRYDAAGSPRGGEFQINSYATDHQGLAEVASDAAGAFVVAWLSFRPDGTTRGVFGQRYDALGMPQGTEFQINTHTTGFQGSPAVAGDGAGSFVVVWMGSDGDGSTAGVFARRYDAAGQPRGGAFLVNAHTTGVQVEPAVAYSSAGDFFVAWEDAALDGSGHGVFGRRFRGRLGGVALAVDPAATGGSDGNGVLEPGESVEVKPSWRNISGQALAFDGTASSFDGPAAPGVSYQLPDANALYGNTGDGTTAQCSDCYQVAVQTSGTRPATHWDATLVEELTADGLGLVAQWAIHLGESFGDVPKASPYYRFVETLLHKGVTGGCAASSYCPANPVTREQAAVFVLAGKEHAGYLPTACTTPVFGDVPASSPYCRFVEELSRRGVVGGCGGGNYCPASPVTREQMPIFVLKTLNPALNPPPCGTPMFADVPASSQFCRWIEELARRGVVSGCGGGNYCPTDPVTREQMAVFISVTFGLALYGP